MELHYSKIGNSDISPRVAKYNFSPAVSNIRRRGEIGGSAKKVGKRIKELERLYGIREGSAGGNGSNQYKKKELEPNNSVEAKSQSDLAAQLGISVDTLQNYKMLAEMIPELDELVSTGIVTKTTALAMMRNLSEKIKGPIWIFEIVTWQCQPY